jgi:serine/threonine protein phosphatase PrpC
MWTPVQCQVSGLLGVARSIGDYDVRLGRKVPGVSAEPTITELILEDGDEFLLLACDGLWEKFTNDSAVNFVRRDLLRSGNVQDAVTKLVKQALVLKVSGQPALTLSYPTPPTLLLCGLPMVLLG